MWFNLDKLNEIILFYKNVLIWRSLLLIPKFKQHWTLQNRTIYFNKRYDNLRFTFARKMKTFLLDSDYFFVYKKNEKIFFNQWSLFTTSSFLFTITSQLFFFYYILFFNSLDYLVYNKYIYSFEKNILLKKKYISLIERKSVINNHITNTLENKFLLYNFFFLTERLLYYFDLYIFYVESFVFNFEDLLYFLKYWFLRKCSAKLKLKIYDDCEFPTHSKYVFFEEKSLWLENLEVFEESNKAFFDKISLDKIFMIWQLYKAKVHHKIDFRFYFMYYKYRFLAGKFEYLKSRGIYLKKKVTFKNLYLFVVNSNNHKNSFNFWQTNKKNTIIIKKYMHMLPIFENRKKLLMIIFLWRRKLERLVIDFQNRWIKVKKNVLNDQKKATLYTFYYILFVTHYQKLYLNTSFKLKFFIKIRKRFIKKKFLRIKTFILFKWIFILYQRLMVTLKCSIKKSTHSIFLFSFFFFYLEKSWFSNITNKVTGSFFENILKRSDAIPYFRRYYAPNKINKFGNFFLPIVQTLVVNFAWEIDNYVTMRYDYLYHTLFVFYKKFWLKINSKFLKSFLKTEKWLLKKITNFYFFFQNLPKLRQIHNLYQLLIFDFWTLSEYKNLLRNLRKLINSFAERKKILNKLAIIKAKKKFLKKVS